MLLVREDWPDTPVACLPPGAPMVLNCDVKVADGFSSRTESGFLFWSCSLEVVARLDLVDTPMSFSLVDMLESGTPVGKADVEELLLVPAESDDPLELFSRSGPFSTDMVAPVLVDF